MLSCFIAIVLDDICLYLFVESQINVHWFPFFLCSMLGWFSTWVPSTWRGWCEQSQLDCVFGGLTFDVLITSFLFRVEDAHILFAFSNFSWRWTWYFFFLWFSGRREDGGTMRWSANNGQRRNEAPPNSWHLMSLKESSAILSIWIQVWSHYPL